MMRLNSVIVLSLICSTLFAQKQDGFFEIQMGALKLDIADVISANTRFSAEFPVAESVFIGAVLDGFLSMPSANGSKYAISLGDRSRYYPSGARLGFVARFAPSSKENHFYSEGSVSYGKVSTTPYRNYTAEKSEWATEYLGEFNFGYNFNTRRERMWGFYIGLGAGMLYSEEYSGDFTVRVRTGVSRQFGFD